MFNLQFRICRLNNEALKHFNEKISFYSKGTLSPNIIL